MSIIIHFTDNHEIRINNVRERKIDARQYLVLCDKSQIINSYKYKTSEICYVDVIES